MPLHENYSLGALHASKIMKSVGLTLVSIALAAIIVGWQTRIAALLLGGFTLLSALIFHTDFSNQVDSIMFLKNVAIAGGFLLLMARGAGPLSLDARTAR